MAIKGVAAQLHGYSKIARRVVRKRSISAVNAKRIKWTSWIIKVVAISGGDLEAWHQSPGRLARAARCGGRKRRNSWRVRHSENISRRRPEIPSAGQIAGRCTLATVLIRPAVFLLSRRRQRQKRNPCRDQ